MERKFKKLGNFSDPPASAVFSEIDRTLESPTLPAHRVLSHILKQWFLTLAGHQNPLGSLIKS